MKTLVISSVEHEASIVFFFFNDTATTEIYTLSLHDALPISLGNQLVIAIFRHLAESARHVGRDRKSTRLNSSHLVISYAVFCLKKKPREPPPHPRPTPPPSPSSPSRSSRPC